jgi:hypothetical protein
MTNMHESSYLLQAFEETPTHMSKKINRLEEGHNLYPLVCRRHAETVSPKGAASSLEEYLEFDESVQLSTTIYDKRDDFNFKIINFPNMCSNIPASPAYGVCITF